MVNRDKAKDAGWGTETQHLYGPPTPYLFNITAAEFNTSMKRKGSEDILHLELMGTPLDPEDESAIEDWETHALPLKCGPGWDTPDNGETAEHPSRKYFDGRTKAGIFIDEIVTNPKLKGLLSELMERGPATKASSWVGLSIVIDETPPKTVTIDGNEVTFANAIPVDYRGTIDVEGVVQQKARKDEELIDQLKKLAKNTPDHATFQNEALSLGVTDSNLLEQITDESENGFYETARKEAE